MVKYLIAALFLALIGQHLWFNSKIDNKNRQIREQREQYARLEEVHSEILGTYTTQIGVLEDDLLDAANLTDTQKQTIKNLEDELQGKIQQIQFLEVTIDTLQNSGTAIVISSPDSVRTYQVEDKKDGVHLTLTLQHPSGDYEYVITQDPLTMELFITREGKSGVKIGAIRFPNNPNLAVSSWSFIYDLDQDPWYKKLWNNVNFRLGLFAGSQTGGAATIGYNKFNAGYLATEQGTSLLFMYDFK